MATSQHHVARLGVNGFTLIELSIVLVIIGLILGGILVGQDLIEQSKIRNQFAQLEEYRSAAHTFRLKYNDMPGDMENPSQFGLDRSPASGSLNTCAMSASLLGNGTLDDNGGGGLYFNGEIMNYFIHLSNAELIPERLDRNHANCNDSGNPPQAGQQFPKGKLDVGLVAATHNNEVYFILGTITTATDTRFDTSLLDLSSELSPVQSYGIDAKLDDGSPDSGTIRSVGDYNKLSNNYTGEIIFDTADGAGNCIFNSEYNVTNTSKLCLLSIRK